LLLGIGLVLSILFIIPFGVTILLIVYGLALLKYLISESNIKAKIKKDIRRFNG